MASRYWVGGGSTQNWAATGNTNWSATSGGANNASVPTSLDDVIFDVNSGALPSTIGANITVLSLTITSGYTGTMTHTGTVTVAGSITFGANYTIAGAAGITSSGTGSITSNGKVFPNSVSFLGAVTRTIVGTWSILGSLNMGAASTMNGSDVIIGNGVTVASTWSGTSNVYLTGGTWSGGGQVQLTSFNIQGNVTLGATVTIGGACILNYVSGTVTTTGSTLFLGLGSTPTLNTAGIVWNNITLNGTNTVTLTSALTATGTLATTTGATSNTFAGAFGFTVGTLNILSVDARILTLANGVTYVVTTSLNAADSRTGSKFLFTSDHATIKAILYIGLSASCNTNASFTRIDASKGRTIASFNGVITDCTNIISYSDVKRQPFQEANRSSGRIGMTNKVKNSVYLQ